jgi:hypothetical protein
MKKLFCITLLIINPIFGAAMEPEETPTMTPPIAPYNKGAIVDIFEHTSDEDQHETYIPQEIIDAEMRQFEKTVRRLYKSKRDNPINF